SGRPDHRRGASRTPALHHSRPRVAGPGRQCAQRTRPAGDGPGTRRACAMNLPDRISLNLGRLIIQVEEKQAQIEQLEARIADLERQLAEAKTSNEPPAGVK